MPKSDTWPGGTEPEMMNGMDSAGSCDSVVSANSGFSEDSLEHLSAEEKACLMFLEETIESLDNEDDSGLSHDEPERLPCPGNLAAKLSHDEPERLPCPGNLAAKLADLSVSMDKSNINSSQKPAKQPMKKNVDTKHTQSYVVPTPLVVASGSSGSVTSTKSPTPVDKTTSSRSQFTSKNKPTPSHNQKRPAPPVPLNVNVAIPPSTKPKENSAKPAEGPLPRGPLSYEALAHLRKTASQKKTPLCPTIDHTINLDKQCPPPMEAPKLENVTKSLSEVHKSKTGPPAVLPKPKKLPANIYVKFQNDDPITPDLSKSMKNSTNPEGVRQEALQKLGLRKEHEHEDGAEAPLPPPKHHSKKSARDPLDPTRNPSFCSSQEQTEPKNRPVKISARVQQHPKEKQKPVLLLHVQSSGLKTEGLERSVNQDSFTKSGNHSDPQQTPCAKPMKTNTTSQPSTETPLDSVGYTAMVVPGMGSDRKEALRKLGLLKR